MRGSCARGCIAVAQEYAWQWYKRVHSSCTRGMQERMRGSGARVFFFFFFFFSGVSGVSGARGMQEGEWQWWFFFSW